MLELPSRAQVVIIGGGIVGCSVAYHLAKRGMTDVVLLERKQLTCGTTWHAAGLVGQLRATHNLTRLAQYTTDLYSDARERRPGQATGFRQRGSLAVATNEERFEELKRGASMARCFGLEVESADTATRPAQLWPLMRTSTISSAACYLPKDGQTNPDRHHAGAGQGRAKPAASRIVENVKVDGYRGRRRARHRRRDGRRRHRGRVSWSTAAGMWAHEIGASAGTTVPLHAAEHFYIVTEPIACISPKHCRCCATPTAAPTSRRTRASCWSAGSSPWPSRGA